MKKTKQRGRSSAGIDVSAVKGLKVKMGVCKRVMKELRSYEQEVEREFAKTENMKNSQVCPFDIKQQVAQIFRPRSALVSSHSQRRNTAIPKILLLCLLSIVYVL